MSMEKLDSLGPEVVMHVYDPVTRMKGVIVLDSLKRGPAKGGIRMSSSATKEEVCGLARAMTLKNALANLPFGGGKSGITVDARLLSSEEKHAQVQAFAKYLAMVAPDNYVAAPDIAMAEKEMRTIAAIAGNASVTGKPVDLGGIPHELGSTGYGVYISLQEFYAHSQESLEHKTVAVQGFGNVGSFAAKFLGEDGSVLVAASDSSATLIDTEGLDVDALKEFKEAGKRFIDYPTYDKHAADAVLFVACDILIPAAQRNVITQDNYSCIQAKVISQGANLPISDEVEVLLEQAGTANIPDILANAGGVISSWVEHEGGMQEEIFDHIKRIISQNVSEMLKLIKDKSLSSRDACLHIAHARLE